MNIHLMLILLSFKEPQSTELPLYELPKLEVPLEIQK